MKGEKASSAIFVVPRSSSSWRGAEAIWVTIAGWALAAEKLLGQAVVVTTDSIAKPKEVLIYPLHEKEKQSPRSSRIVGLLPTFFRLFLKDMILLLKNKPTRFRQVLPVRKSVKFVWEQHDLFEGRGLEFSKKYRAPLVKYVHAPVVWEASKWGVKRYFWGVLLEKLEARSLKKADVVLVVSEEVKLKLVEMGVDKEKILISPMGVNPEIFTAKISEQNQIKENFEIGDNLIFGWTGSFRPFHGLDQVVKAFSKVEKEFPNIRLMLVGDGGERKETALLSRQLNIQDKVIFTGKKEYLEIPKYLELFDIAIVSAVSAEDFHYSPLKLREYWASGKAVIAPKAGEIGENFKNNVELKLFTPGDIEELASAMIELIENQDKRKFLASNGKAKVLKEGTWEVELKKLLSYLEK